MVVRPRPQTVRSEDHPHNSNVGGICGENDGIIGDPNGGSWVWTSVNITGALDPGGFCSKNDHEIHYAYSTGTVTGTIDNVIDLSRKNLHYAGFVGHLGENPRNGGSIDHCYSQGAVRLNVDSNVAFEDIDDDDQGQDSFPYLAWQTTNICNT